MLIYARFSLAIFSLNCYFDRVGVRFLDYKLYQLYVKFEICDALSNVF